MTYPTLTRYHIVTVLLGSVWPLSIYSLASKLRQGYFVLCQRKMKLKMCILTLVGGKKKVGKWLFLAKINKFHKVLCSFWQKISLSFGHDGGKKMICQFLFLSGVISPLRRTLSTKQYSESGLMVYFKCQINSGRNCTPVQLYGTQHVSLDLTSLAHQNVCYSWRNKKYCIVIWTAFSALWISFLSDSPFRNSYPIYYKSMLVELVEAVKPLQPGKTNESHEVSLTWFLVW